MMACQEQCGGGARHWRGGNRDDYGSRAFSEHCEATFGPMKTCLGLRTGAAWNMSVTDFYGENRVYNVHCACFHDRINTTKWKCQGWEFCVFGVFHSSGVRRAFLYVDETCMPNIFCVLMPLASYHSSRMRSTCIVQCPLRFGKY